MLFRNDDEKYKDWYNVFKNKNIIIDSKKYNKYLNVCNDPYWFCSSSFEIIEIFKFCINEYGERILNGKFIDIGSGLGFPVFLSEKYGFKQSIGIELDKTLFETSVKNKNIIASNAVFYNMDILDYIFPKNITCIYMFNPVHDNKQTMNKIFEKILNYFQNNKKTLVLIYVNPLENAIKIINKHCKIIKYDFTKYSLLQYIVCEINK